MAFAHITAKQPKCWPDNCLLIPFLSLVDVVTVADIDDENCVSNSLLQILKLRFGHEVKFCSDFEHRVGQDFEVEVQATF